MNLIIDLQNDSWYHIDFILDSSNIPSLNKEILEYLLNESMIFTVPDFVKENFSDLDMRYYSSNHIENAIVDFNEKSNFSIEKTVNILSALRCKTVQLRAFKSGSIHKMIDFFNESQYTSIETIEVLILFEKNYQDFIDKLKKFPNFLNILFHSVDENEKVESSSNILFTKEKINSSKHCGIISPYFFSGNQGHVLKSINHNSCLYNKIGIDEFGNVKNCPSMSTSIGEIDNLTINDFNSFLKNSRFSIKDDIEVCKDCEFRYICNDCRVFTDSNSRPNARPAKCQYNPYISKWSHEDGFRTLAECGVISNENEFSIDHNRIAEINKEIWGEE
jgi:SPASM domain peptide maturase of grasp-with-spasm system